MPKIICGRCKQPLKIKRRAKAVVLQCDTCNTYMRFPPSKDKTHEVERIGARDKKTKYVKGKAPKKRKR